MWSRTEKEDEVGGERKERRWERMIAKKEAERNRRAKKPEKKEKTMECATHLYPVVA